MTLIWFLIDAFKGFAVSCEQELYLVRTRSITDLGLVPDPKGHSLMFGLQDFRVRVTWVLSDQQQTRSTSEGGTRVYQSSPDILLTEEQVQPQVSRTRICEERRVQKYWSDKLNQ